MSNKYYAIKAGKKTGVFEDWNEVKDYVEGYSNSKFKSFSTLQEAKIYLEEDTGTIEFKPKGQVSDELSIQVYVSGSFSEKNRRYSFGTVILQNNNVIQELEGTGNEADFLEISSISGEINGVMSAIKWTFDNNHPQIDIFYDYAGIESWANGDWEAQKEGTKIYIEFVNSYKDKINIIFNKVDSRNEYSKRAKTIATETLQNYSPKEEFEEWAKINLGNKTGMWYAPYIDKMGIFLRDFDLDKGLEIKDNFFEYQTYEEFKGIYQQIIGQTDEDLVKILKGSPIRYPDTYAKQKLDWNQKYAQMEVDKGIRSNPENLGGIADLGAILRAYLKYLYYSENPEKIYPKKGKKINENEIEFDDSINYWIYSPGEDARLWDEFYNKKVMGLGWDLLGDLKQYSSRKEMEKRIAENRNDGKRPTNDSKAVWDFYSEIQLGDIVYVKLGVSKIIGKGTVTGEYFFADTESEYKHRHKVDWTNKGMWDLKEKAAMKTLTKLNSYPDFIVYIEQIINEEEVEEKSLFIGEFTTWLSQEEQSNGTSLNDKTIKQKLSSLKDIEKYFGVEIFGETDRNALKNIKETVLESEEYDKYTGVSGSSIDYYIKYIDSKPVIIETESYLLADFLAEVFISPEQLKIMRSVLQNKKNLIFKGAPGVGKTFIADRLAYLMMGEKDDSRIQMVQFHQSYSYEDFIEGYRPKTDGEGFELNVGPFVRFSQKAERDPERDYFFIIDEINRGNMSKIFGELMVLIETDKRGKSINLLYSNNKFSVPENLYIIGMMNTADRSLALIDYALRRRFSFFELQPAFENETFKKYIETLSDSKSMNNVLKEIQKLNQEIVQEFGKGFQIGHSYFVGEAFEAETSQRIQEVLEYEIIPQLYEYWFDNEERAKEWADRVIGAYNEN